MVDALLDKKVIVCVGSGGVGKTTLSASLGVMAAQSGLKTLVMTIDPSRRLKSALGLSDTDFGVTKVPGQNYKGELYASLLNAEEIFKDFIKSSSSTEELADALLKNRLYKQLSTTLSGSQEFTSLLQLSKLVDQSDFDLVILDTPPAQHAIDFLESPEKLNALFQDSVVKWFLGESDDVGFIRKIIAKSTLTVLAALKKITGSVFMEELNDFFRSVKGIQEKISRKTLEVKQLLQRDSTTFLLVTAFDEAKLSEASRLKSYLAGQNYRLSGLVINRAHPQWFKSGLSTDNMAIPEKVQQEFDSWLKFFENRNSHYEDFILKWGLGMPVMKLPELEIELTGLEPLEVMGNEIQKESTTH